MIRFLATSLMIFLVAHLLEAEGITLSGVVLDKRTKMPVVSADIRILDHSGTILGTTSTNAQGQWSCLLLIAGVDGRDGVPGELALRQNYPNPFNPSTRIPFTIPQAGRVHIAVHNILGQVLDSKDLFLTPGSYNIEWQASGSAGVLFYSVEMNGSRQVWKMVQLDGGKGGGLGEISSISNDVPPSARWIAQLDSCQVVASSLLHEADSLTLALVDGARGDFLLETVHDRATVVDLHNDVLEKIAASGYTYQLSQRHSFNHTDIPRLRDGGVDAQMFAIYVGPVSSPSPGYYFSTAMRYLDSLDAQFQRNTQDIGFALRADSVGVLNQQQKIAGVLMLEGGHCIEDNIDNLQTLYSKGVRCMTITWNNSTSWAVSAADSQSATVGLSDFGKQVIRTMDSLGMIIDVSHVGRKTIEDILATTKNPIIASHSGAYSLRGHYRNLTDNQIDAIAQRGGVIGVVFYPSFLSGTSSASIQTVVQHIDYIRNLVGVDYIALGSDFDGIGSVPVGLEDVSRFPALTEALLRRGYSRQDVGKILGGNFLRVFQAVCQ